MYIMRNPSYERTSKSFCTELITNYRLTFFIRHGSPLLRVCNASSVSGTAGSIDETDFLQFLVGQTMIVPEFQKHCGNDALVACNSKPTFHLLL